MYNNIKRLLLVIVLLHCFSYGAFAQKYKLEAVDLGLSVKWANMNVGAETPYEYGGYYAWGEIEEKRFYYFNITSKYIVLKFEGSGDPDNTSAVKEIVKYSPQDNKVVLEDEDDVAFKTFGKEWRMPTAEQMQELMDKCDWSPARVNGTKGFLIKSRVNENSIFLPLAGYKTGHETKGTIRQFASTQGYYWTSSLSEDSKCENGQVLGIFKTERPADLGSYSMMSFHRTNGCVVRPVCK